MTLKKQAAKVRKAGYKNSGQDSILAHITPEEARLLQDAGGSGRTDPHTGLPHFDAGESDGVGGFNDGAAGLGDFGGFSANENDNGGFSTGLAGFGDVTGIGDLGSWNEGLTDPDLGYSLDASAFSNPDTLTSLFGKQGKSALMSAVNALGVPMLGSALSAATSQNAQDANAAMGKGFLGSVFGLMGSALGPVGALGGAMAGNSMGAEFGAIPAMSSADTAAAFEGMSPTANAGDLAPKQTTGGGFGNGSLNPGNFFKNFLTSYAGSGLTSLGQGLFGSSQAPNQQPQASYPEGTQSNSSNLYSMITGQEPPQQSTPWNSMESLAPNMVGSSAGSFSPSGGEYTQPTATAQGFSMPTMGQAGNFVGNNLGSLVTGLYGMYNNRRQQGQIRDQMRSLQSLYAPGSPYAQQLQAKIAANAAARGTRSNVAGREVQLQAALADKNASMAPTLAQMQGGMGTLQNREMMNLLTMAKDTGLLKSLGSLFQSGG